MYSADPLHLLLLCHHQLLHAAAGGALALGVCFFIYKKPSWGIWWVTMLFSPVLFVWHLVRVLALAWGNSLGLTKRSPQTAAKIATAIAARRAQAKFKGEQVQVRLPQQQPEQQQEDSSSDEDEDQDGATATAGVANGTAAGSETKPGSTPNRTGRAPAAAEAPAAAPAAVDPAAEFGSAAAYPPKASMRRRATRVAGVTVWSLFNGPWWPGSFRPIELAFTCYWWIRLVGWVVPCRVLEAVVIACKLTFVVAAFSVAAAAFGAASSWLTVQTLVQVVLLRIGAGAGVLWVASCVLDDVARVMDPIKWAKRQQQRQQRRGRLPRPWQQPLHKRRQEQKQRRQQQRDAANPYLNKPVSPDLLAKEFRPVQQR
jgi:hypothetical protein